ncbi:MAG: hypothetical protein ACK4Z5_00035 [Brevundimonas sp.]
MTAEDLAALSRAVRHNVGWLDVPADAEDALRAMRDRVGRGLFRELGRLPANSPNITFKITEEGRAAAACASLAA